MSHSSLLGTPASAERGRTGASAESTGGDDAVVDFGAAALRCRRGLTSAERPTYWKLMMGFYPPQRTSWPAVEARALSQYADIAHAVLAPDGAAVAQGRHVHAVSMDVPRTMFHLAFFGHDTHAGRPRLSAAVETSAAETTVAETPRWWHDCIRDAGDDATCGLTPAQEALWRLLCTLAAVNQGIGYVQGMNELAGHLLYAFAGGEPALLTRSVEADTFFCLQTLLGYLGDNFCRALDFDPDTGVTSTLRHYDHALSFFDQPLARHLRSVGITSAHYALRWMTLLFTQELDVQEALRVWDFLLSFGDELRTVTVLVAVAICHCRRAELLRRSTLEEVMPRLLSTLPGQTAVVLHTVRCWLRQFDLPFAHALKTATPERVAELRRRHLAHAAPGTACVATDGADDDNSSRSTFGDRIMATLRAL